MHRPRPPEAAAPGAVPISFSVDVEEWFHAEALREHVARHPACRQQTRVEDAVAWLLELLERHGARGTFFVLGEVAERHPALVRRIAAAGHELGTHGYDHQLLFRQSPEQFRRHIRRATAAVEDLVGSPVLGFRAPKFSLTDWSLEILHECGLTYDSSFYAHLGRARYPHLRERPLPQAGVVRAFRNGLAEVALTLARFGGLYVPWSGGGFFRVLPYFLWRHETRRLLREQGGFTFFLHPWEIDTGQPVQAGIGARKRFKHYTGRQRLRTNLERLLTDFPVQPLARTLAAARAGLVGGAAGAAAGAGPTATDPGARTG